MRHYHGLQQDSDILEKKVLRYELMMIADMAQCVKIYKDKR
jgi:hypothetical protein